MNTGLEQVVVLLAPPGGAQELLVTAPLHNHPILELS